MISAWWLIPALMVGAVVGWFAHALVVAGERGDEQMQREIEFESRFNLILNASHPDPAGKRGLIAFCPKCGRSSADITWDAEKDICRCICGWTNEEVERSNGGN